MFEKKNGFFKNNISRDKIGCSSQIINLIALSTKGIAKDHTRLNPGIKLGPISRQG